MREFFSSYSPRFSAADWADFEHSCGLTFPAEVVFMASRVPAFVIEERVEEDQADDDSQEWIDVATVRLPCPGGGGRAAFEATTRSREKTEYLLRRSGGGKINLSSDGGTSEKVDMPFSFYPGIPGLLQWGNNGSGDSYFWVAESRSRDWPLVVTDYWRWKIHRTPILDLVARQSQGTIECPVLGERWNQPAFTPLDP